MITEAGCLTQGLNRSNMTLVHRVSKHSGYFFAIPQTSASLPQTSGCSVSLPQTSGCSASLPQTSGCSASLPTLMFLTRQSSLGAGGRVRRILGG